MIAVAVCYGIEMRWVRRLDGVCFVRTAVGARAPEALDALSREADVSMVVSTGFCGGLQASLSTGDLVFADVIRHDGEEILVSPELLRVAGEALDRSGHRAQVGTWESVSAVADGAGKRRLAEGGSLCVEMESGPLARWARTRSVDLLPLRVVFDPVGGDLPFAADDSLFGCALRHPVWSLRAARWAVIAGRALGRALNDLLPALKEGS